MNDINFNKEWDFRLTPKRFRGTTATNIPQGWNPFDSDYARISMSAPFRRLQDKAQVFPLEPNDFVRTRLTHSIEVSSVARSLGVRVENWLRQKGYLGQNKIGHIPSILATASLAHDIGNPPFGHFGEKSIRTFFKKKESILNGCLNESELADLLNFDGNIQGLRLLLRLGLASDEFSYNLTFPTLATTIKYPRDSLNGNKKDAEGISSKKYGFYQTDADKYSLINKTLNLHGQRHPLCFLLESADDVCYSVSDIEDGFKKNTIDIHFLLETLKNDYIEDIECKNLYDLLINLTKKYSSHENKTALIAQDCRVFAQRQMIDAAYDSFIENHDKIISGSFDNELIENSKSAMLRKFFGEISHKNFNHESVIKSELLGDTVLTYLLDRFYEAIMSNEYNDPKTSHGKIYSLLSHQSRNAMKRTDYSNEKYLKILMAIDFVAGMTDTYALSLYQNLLGLN